MLTAQRSTLRFLSRLKATAVQIQKAVQTWICQEIVDDDPYDVDTLFPHDPSNQRSCQKSK